MAAALQMLRRHWGISSLIGVAAVVRILVMVAYPPAFWFFGDSGSYISPNGGLANPQPFTALGYTFFLQLFRPTGGFYVVIALQHLAGLAMAAGVYAFLRHRRVPVWLACVAAMPVLFDSLQLTLEHYLLTETLFTSLLVIGVFMLLTPRAPGLWTCVGAGTAIGLAWVTRPSTLPVIILLAGYLLLRRVHWRKVVAMTAAFLFWYGAVMVWVSDNPSVYRGSWAARAFYSRTAVFADCAKLELTAQQRALCPTEPVGQRHDRADWYGWNGPMAEIPVGGLPEVSEFALAAVTQQPGDYLRTVTGELALYFLPGQQIGPEHDCLREKWNLPVSTRSLLEPGVYCHPAMAQKEFRSRPADSSRGLTATPLTEALHQYSNHVRTPQLLISLAFLMAFGVAGTVRRFGWRDAGDTLLLAGLSLSLLLPPVLFGMYDARYGLPALPFISVMGALAASQLFKLRHEPDGGDTAHAPGRDLMAVGG